MPQSLSKRLTATARKTIYQLMNHNPAPIDPTLSKTFWAIHVADISDKTEIVWAMAIYVGVYQQRGGRYHLLSKVGQQGTIMKQILTAAR